MTSAAPENKRGELKRILVAWLMISLVVGFLARRNTTEPGLYYDETQAAGMARDFLIGHAHHHMIESKFAEIGGRPFPIFLQNYIGAVKSWMLLLSFAVFGADATVLRLTALAWMLVILLVFMLWAGRWLGAGTAIMAGWLLALDPSFFYMTTLDWGLVLPSLLCRLACFNFALRAREMKSLWFGLLAGLFAGLGFLNKIDFAILLGCVVFALLWAHSRQLTTEVVRRELPKHIPLFAVMLVGFLIVATPMLLHIPRIILGLSAGGHHPEFIYKLHVLVSMFDGSYFPRLMDAGGMFGKMFDKPFAVFSLFGAGFVAACIWLVLRKPPHAAFLLLATVCVIAGVLWLPGAVVIHHMTLVYPFPHLVIAWAATNMRRRMLGAMLVTVVVVSQLYVLLALQWTIHQSGGRGRWSGAIGEFAESVNHKSNLTVMSLDWGFSEQLAFLTDGPILAESFWSSKPLDPGKTNIVYLVHPPEFTFYDTANQYREWAQKAGTNQVDMQAWRDREGRVAFYSFRFRGN